MQPDALDEGRRWLEQSKLDLDDARYNREGGRHSLACFLSQQAAEKALKGFMTRYPNGLPGGLPGKAFGSDDSERALTKAQRIVGAVAGAFDRQGGHTP